MIESAEFRRILGHLVSGVTVVTARDAEGRPRGLTATAVCSVSLEPTLVLVCIEKGADTYASVRRARAFAINVLDHSQERLARRFAADADGKFEGVAYREEVTGAPVLEQALAWTDCTLSAEYDAGDHTIFIGEVVAGDAREGGPLLYYRGGYARLAP